MRARPARAPRRGRRTRRRPRLPTARRRGSGLPDRPPANRLATPASSLSTSRSHRRRVGPVVARKHHFQSASAGGLAGSAAFLLSEVGFESTRRFRSMLEPLGLEPRQFALLRHVSRAEGQTQQALGDALGIPKSRMVALIDDLEERGLVERRPRPDDRRARALYVTPEGARCLDEAIEIAAAHEAFVRERLSPGEHRQLVELLRRLTDDVDVHPALRSDYEPLR